MELIIASANAHKITEISSITPSFITLLSMKDIGITDDIPETAPTLEGNALQKARYIYSRTGKACFADDTGLEVDALGGEPGVYSARYAQIFDPTATSHNAAANVALLLKKLQNAPSRTAQFRTVIALILPDGTEHLFQGEIKGEITSDLRGNEGFGYDPIFIPHGYNQTFAQMPAELKNRISHRGLATAKLIQFLEKWQ